MVTKIRVLQSIAEKSMAQHTALLLSTISLFWYAEISLCQPCGGRLTKPNGIITSPNYPNSYYDNVACIWVIIAPYGARISIRFTDMRIQNSSSCAYDYVQVNNGEAETAPLLGRFCGVSLPADITSTSNRLYLKFQTDNSAVYRGFSANYSTCGGRLTMPNGVITSPYYPNSYYNNAVCIWVITAPEGARISIRFTDIQTEDSSSCAYDYVQVNDGEVDTAPLLVIFCDISNPGDITSTSNRLYLKFRTDMSYVYRGFAANYTTCGGRLTMKNGVITSPYYPSSYYNNAVCIWIIIAPENTKINLWFTDIQMENSSNCAHDYLQVNDGEVETATLLGKFCGISLPAVITSTSNRLYLKFRTDMSYVYRGFAANYTTCGGRLTTPNGVITSPNYPNFYYHNDVCIWVIIAPEGARISFRLTDMQMEKSSTCAYDYLQVYDGEADTAPLLGRFCGVSLPADITSTSNRLYLKFQTDDIAASRGFSANYSNCGGRLTTTDGVITSPNYPSSYYNNGVCIWVISTPEGSNIRFWFTDIQIENSSSCANDYLQVNDGEVETAPLLGRFCGFSLPAVLSSTSSRLYLRFQTNSSTVYPGFAAKYTTCRARLTMPSGVITSPNYPNSYHHNDGCSWIIIALEGSKISLRLTDIQMENSTSCDNNYLQVNDGEADTAPLLGRFCGYSLPADIISTSNRLYLKFQTNGSAVSHGFSAHYSTCGGHLDMSSGIITSPHYPSNYSNNINCTWVITVPGCQRVSLKFTNMDTQTEHDFIQINDGEDETAPSYGNFSGSVILPVMSSSNRLYLSFKTDLAVTKSGFHAAFTAVTSPSSVQLVSAAPNALGWSWLGASKVCEGWNLFFNKSTENYSLATISKNYTGLYPDTSYTLSIRCYGTRTNITRSCDWANITGRTDEADPGPVQIRSARSTNDSITISWTDPKNPGGVLLYYVIVLNEFTTDRCLNKTVIHCTNRVGRNVNYGQKISQISPNCKTSTNVSSSCGVTLESTFTNLQPFTRYTAKMYAVNSKDPSVVTQLTITKKSEPIVKMLNATLRNKISRSVVIEKKTISFELPAVTDVFSTSNGLIVSFQLLVVSTRDHKNFKETTNLQPKTWAKSKGNKFKEPYAPFPAEYIDDSNRWKSSSQKRELTIGNEDCNPAAEERICNGPLNPGTHYCIYMRGWTKGGYADSYCIVSGATKYDNVLTIACSVIAGAFLIAIILIVVLVLKRRSSTSLAIHSREQNFTLTSPAY